MKNHFGTIIQLSTPKAKSAIHIIRVSGDDALTFLTKQTSIKNPQPRRAYYTPFFDHNQQTIDHILAIYFKGPSSYTGENMVELHCHGSLLIVNQIIKTALKNNLTLALPGEFSSRAFLNGKMNLHQAEAVNSIINAQNSYLKENSLKILEKKHSFQFNDIKQTILHIIADLETSVEFSEEEIDYLKNKKKLFKNYNHSLTTIKSYFQTIISNFDKGKKLDEGTQCAIMGQPNAGKSTLMNLLLREERVLVSSIKGTTRDFVKENIFIKGFPITLFDTAGIRKTAQLIEKKSIEKTFELLKKTDIAIYLIDNLTALNKFIKIKNKFSHSNLLLFISKADILSANDIKKIKNTALTNKLKIINSLSIKKKNVIKIIENEIIKSIQKNYNPNRETPALLNERQKTISNKIVQRINQLQNIIKELDTEEIILEELRLLNELLEELDLKIENSDILDTIFSKFCLGK